MPWTGPAPVTPPPGFDPARAAADPAGAAAYREAEARAAQVRIEKAKVREREKLREKGARRGGKKKTRARLQNPLDPPSPTPQLLREQVKACYKDAGVNHLQDCAALVDAYLEAARGGGGRTALLNGGRRG